MSRSSTKAPCLTKQEWHSMSHVSGTAAMAQHWFVHKFSGNFYPFMKIYLQYRINAKIQHKSENIFELRYITKICQQRGVSLQYVNVYCATWECPGITDNTGHVYLILSMVILFEVITKLGQLTIQSSMCAPLDLPNNDYIIV